MRHEILEALHEDHVNMSRIAALIGAGLAEIEADGEADYALLEDLMAYATAYPDTQHHPTEDVVFAALGQVAPETVGDIGLLLAEHETLIEAGRVFLEAVRAVEDEALVARADFRTKGRRYLDMLTSHMNKEESGLFRVAADRLSAEDWAGIGAQIQRLPDPLFGATVEADFRRLRQRISARAPSV